jgi:hypothetical protein
MKYKYFYINTLLSINVRETVIDVNRVLSNQGFE